MGDLGEVCEFSFIREKCCAHCLGHTLPTELEGVLDL